MVNLFSKVFGGGKKPNVTAEIYDLVEESVETLIQKGNFDLSFELSDLKKEKNQDYAKINVELFGEDETLLTDKDGILLDAIQLYLKRVVQHQLPDESVDVNVDCNGFREQATKELVELAEKLKGIALNKGKSVYFRALPPKDRKIIHQYLAEDERVKSRSVGDGLYKKIKIFPVGKGGGRGGNRRRRNDAQETRV